MSSLSSRALLSSIWLAGSLGCTAPRTVTPDGEPTPVPGDDGRHPLALVYRGSGACEGCPESLAQLLEQAGYATRYVSPNELTRDDVFQGVSLYAQPGGDGTELVLAAVGPTQWPAVAGRVRAFVAGGGAYLGVCLGGFLAGEWMDDDGNHKAFELLEGEVGTFTGTPRDHVEDQVITVDWLRPAGKRSVYFQEGPYFEARGVEYARYHDGKTAALLTTFGRGKVAVSGVHFEADDEWYEENGLVDPDGLDADLGLALIQALR